MSSPPPDPESPPAGAHAPTGRRGMPSATAFVLGLFLLTGLAAVFRYCPSP
jgi:hypothetical protein